MSGNFGRSGSLSSVSISSLQAGQSSSMESLESTTSMSCNEGEPPSIHVRVATLTQENAVLKSELELLRLKCKNLSEENRVLRQASVNIQAQAEQEEEFISNTLLKKIHSLKKEKEALALNYEQEEEFLTNDLSRKLSQLRQEKVQLEQTLEQEQEHQVSKLMKKIEKLEKEVIAKQSILEQLRREKIDLENTLEQEQEMLVNRLWKRMDKVEAEKRDLEAKVGTTPPPSPSDRTDPALLNSRITQLLREVQGLRRKLADVETKHKTKMQEIGEEEKALKEENVRLQKKLQRETERSEALSRALSESESNLEIDEERMFNEMTAGRGQHSKSPVSFSPSPTRRSVSPSSIVLANTSAFNPPSPYLGRGHHRTSSLETNQVHMHSPLHSSSGSSLTAPKPRPRTSSASRTKAS